jgi:hypothetical protein
MRKFVTVLSFKVTEVALARYARDTKITENNFFALRSLWLCEKLLALARFTRAR